MDDPSRMRCAEPLGYLNRDLQQFAQAHAGTRDQIIECLAPDVLHCDERAAVLLAGVMNRADIRVIQSGSGAGLALEAVQRLRIAREFATQELECYEAVEPCVLRFVDHPHPAAAQFSGDAVVGDRRAGRKATVFARDVALLSSNGPRRHFDRRVIQEPLGLPLRSEQGPDLALQCRVAVACVAQKCLALFTRTIQHRLQDLLNLFPSLGVHGMSRQ